ncbi:hypothetical protein EDI_190500 [Entamoeba dispar SAW760]|uniref:Uncharacterized protein n=1 Tax=Entamoeba dispar (strain ATCC PRA-260 / SAW760) TaxID=370354 RepID=B0E618_ENTDS|nr:uncharacterized protein EDI_190500 [Entamoeba dispar SAW760]EDR29991.1 hypothetical protein EDI_190500 [Entamoeba dispar SAW760]|eukprot:EDR29991.1 hypothetical protein EDI_190500 [Entamoeba dispar SAW760]
MFNFKLDSSLQLPQQQQNTNSLFGSFGSTPTITKTQSSDTLHPFQNPFVFPTKSSSIISSDNTIKEKEQTQTKEFQSEIKPKIKLTNYESEDDQLISDDDDDCSTISMNDDSSTSISEIEIEKREKKKEDNVSNISIDQLMKTNIGSMPLQFNPEQTNDFKPEFQILPQHFSEQNTEKPTTDDQQTNSFVFVLPEGFKTNTTSSQQQNPFLSQTSGSFSIQQQSTPFGFIQPTTQFNFSNINLMTSNDKRKEEIDKTVNNYLGKKITPLDEEKNKEIVQKLKEKNISLTIEPDFIKTVGEKYYNMIKNVNSIDELNAIIKPMVESLGVQWEEFISLFKYSTPEDLFDLLIQSLN